MYIYIYIYALISDIHFSFFLTSLCITGPSFIHSLELLRCVPHIHITLLLLRDFLKYKGTHACPGYTCFPVFLLAKYDYESKF